jgi:hypothetical protein
MLRGIKYGYAGRFITQIEPEKYWNAPEIYAQEVLIKARCFCA